MVVVSAVALSEKVPDPQLRPHSFTLRVGELLDLDECAAELVSAGYERVDQVEERGQFALRGGLLDVFPATEERAVRVDMFDVEIESLRWFSTFTQRSLGDAEEVEIAPAAELALEHRELAEIAAEQAQPALAGAGAARGWRSGGGEGAVGEDAERPDIAELLPVERFGALLDLVGADTELVVAAEEDLEPVLDDHWSDVCAAFGDEDAHHLYVSPQSIRATLAERARIWLSALSSGQEIELRAQSADTRRALAGRGRAGAREARALGLPHGRGVSAPRRGRARGVQPRAPESDVARRGRRPQRSASAIRFQPLEPSLRFAAASLREGFVAPQLKLAVFPEHRLLRRAPGASAPRAPARAATAAWAAHAEARCARSRNCARATSSCTRTTAWRASRASRRARWRT